MSYLSEKVHAIICTIPNKCKLQHRILDDRPFGMMAGVSICQQWSIFGSFEKYFESKAQLDKSTQLNYEDIVSFAWNHTVLYNLGSAEMFNKAKSLFLTDGLAQNLGLAGDSLSNFINELDDDCTTNLLMLKITAALERFLGNVYLSVSKAKSCPSLLRDLLNTTELDHEIGTKTIAILKTLIGTTNGLNLRNVLWHGFPMIGEISSEYNLCFLEAWNTIRKVVNDKQTAVYERPKLEFKGKESLSGIFPILELKHANMVRNIFKSSLFVPLGMLPSWKFALHLFFRERFADAVILLLPQLEHGLRCLFTVVNDCPKRRVTAECDDCYTTFDEILAENWESNSNNLICELGQNITEMLYDLLFFPEGPRLRDRISHANYDLKDVDKIVANHVICLATCICLKFLLPWKKFIATSNDILTKLTQVANYYHSVYHPSSLLIKEVEYCLHGLEELNTKYEHVENEVDRISVDVDETAKEYIKVSTAYCEVAMPRLGKVDSASMFEIVKRCIQAVIDEPRQFLHRPKSEIEALQISRRMVNNISCAIKQIIETVDVRQVQHEKKIIRSRGRKNFHNLVLLIPKLQLFCLLILLIVSVECLTGLIGISTTSNGLHFTRYLKKCLKFTENIASLSGPSKNRWQECVEVAELLLCHVRKRIQSFSNYDKA